jgi:hypothetical protein
VQQGYGLLFLAHFAVLGSASLYIDKLNQLSRFYRDVDYPDDAEKAKSAAQGLIEELRQSGFTARDGANLAWPRE